ncbi:hypothetical protein C1645_145302 [Glomus cerebriforme]|uniref:Protein kinase domain-containing protein n=1 Tax=Glomus cerebriforme TaxID=658196 RepID=A0A397RZ64_9GLOM|nr:hypothetical protein C1645_145302 [Glomus cerebriforme]
MSNNAELKATIDSNEEISIEDAISKQSIKHYVFEDFCNRTKIGTGGFGIVYRANLKNSCKDFALKSFINFNNATVKEIIHEIKLQREVDFHDNIIRFYGVTRGMISYSVIYFIKILK